MNASEAKLIGVAWFREDEWPKLREVVDDPKQLESSFEDWRSGAEKHMVDLLARGIQAEPVYVHVDELVEWCQENKRPVNLQATSDYVAERMQAMYSV